MTLRKRTPSRIWEVDFFRGISILLVIVDHAMYDFARVFTFWQNGPAFLAFLNELGKLYLSGEVRYFWRPAFLFVFFFTSGLCTAFSRNNALRGLRLAIVAAGISVVTYYADILLGTSVYAMFGVLHCLATIILIYALFDFLIRSGFFIAEKIRKKPVSEKAVRWTKVALCLALGVIFAVIHSLYNVPLTVVTSSNQQVIETESKILGLFFYCDNWFTADYFPLFPFISFFFFGAAFSRIFYNKKRTLLPALDSSWHYVCTLPGRYSIFFYLGGQIAVILIGGLISLAVFGRFM